MPTFNKTLVFEISKLAGRDEAPKSKKLTWRRFHWKSADMDTLIKVRAWHTYQGWGNNLVTNISKSDNKVHNIQQFLEMTTAYDTITRMDNLHSWLYTLDTHTCTMIWNNERSRGCNNANDINTDVSMYSDKLFSAFVNQIYNINTWSEV